MTRIGASQAFFNIVAQFNAEKLIRDTRSLNTVMRAVSLDTFEAILKPIDDMILQMDNAINAVKDFGTELGDATVEFEKFYGESRNLERVKDDLIEVGEAYAFVGTEALAAGSRASQVANIIGRQNVDLLVEQAAILAEISDLTLEEAQRGIIQLNQQAGILYGEMTRQQLMSLGARQQEIILTENSARALDVLNTVANRSVALEGDLVKTMTNFASGAKLAGDSFEFMAAASATLLEAGEEQGTAGRALRMIYARLGGDINGARSKVEAMGFELTNAEGNMKSMQEVLEELNNKGWAELNPAVKQNIAQTIAGNRHYVRFIKLMENYERTTQLTADAFQRLDSAQEQADKALQSNVRQLQTAEAEVQNLKAAIGEGLMPFMIESTRTTRDFLQATEYLTDGLGGLGGALGRGIGVFRMTEGFLKFGIGLQSVSIGLDMFSSVQRSLHGVEVAMANLHSKQAAFLDYGVTATLKQKNLMQGQLFAQQNINRANKEIQLAKMLMVDSDTQLKNNAERRADLAEKITTHNEKLAVLEHQRVEIVQMRHRQELAGDSLYAQRAARIEYENNMGRELLEVQKEIYATKSGAEDAYMRQMLADFDVFGNFNEEERRSLERKNESLREQHTLFQQIKAENEAIRSLTTYAYDDEEDKYMKGRGRQGALNLQAEELEIVKETIRQMSTKAQFKAAEIRADEKASPAAQEFAMALEKQVQNYSELDGAMSGNLENLELSTGAYHGLMDILKQVAGEYYQTERGLRTIAAAEKDDLKMKKDLVKVQSAINAIEKAKKANRAEMISIDLEDMAIKQQVAPLLELIEKAEGDRVTQAQRMSEIITILTTKEAAMNDKMKERRDLLAAEYQQSDQFIKDKERRAMAYKSLTMSVSSLASVLAGSFLKGTAGAAASMGIMGTQIASAAIGVGKAGVEFSKLQTKIYYSQLGLEAATTKAQKFGAAMRVMSTTLLPLVAVGGALYLFAKRQEEINKTLEESSDLLDTVDNAFSRLGNTTTLFGEDDALSETLGIANYELRDLLHNSELTAQVYDQLSNHGMDFNKSIQAAIDDGLDLLEVIKGIQNQSSAVVSEEELNKSIDAMNKAVRGGFGTALQDITGLGGMRYRRSELEKFYEMMGFGYEGTGLAGEDGFGTAMGRLMDDITASFRDGIKMTDDQMAQLKKTLKDDEMYRTIANVNEMMGMSADDATHYTNQIENGFANVKTEIDLVSTEVENLTEDIYNFGNAREELFFGGKYGNVTGSLYKQVVTQGVGTLYHKNEIIMSNNFHGFFNEQEAANRIIAVLDQYIATQG